MGAARLRLARRCVARGPVEQGGHQPREQGSVGEPDQARSRAASGRDRSRLRARVDPRSFPAPALARADLFETAQRTRRLQLEVPALDLAQLVAVAVAQPRVDLGASRLEIGALELEVASFVDGARSGGRGAGVLSLAQPRRQHQAGEQAHRQNDETGKERRPARGHEPTSERTRST